MPLVTGVQTCALPISPSTPALGDEGAANHIRLCGDYGDAGLELFVYGRGAANEPMPAKYPARPTRQAAEAIARLHGLRAAHPCFVRQQAAVIDQGVFQHTVIAVGNRELLKIGCASCRECVWLYV